MELLKDTCAFSSVGQSTGVTYRVSGVRIPQRVPRSNKHAVDPVNGVTENTPRLNGEKGFESSDGTWEALTTWRVNLAGTRGRFETGACLTAWASSAPLSSN